MKHDFAVTWEEKGRVVREPRFALGDLAEKISRRSPGQKIAYITDMAGGSEVQRFKGTGLTRNGEPLNGEPRTRIHG